MPPSRLFGAFQLPRHARPNLATRIRWSSTNPNQAQKVTSRIERIEKRLPNFLARYVRPLRNAPVSHITAFLILHEITAIVPLFLLTFAFHKFDWLPPYISEGAWVKQGMQKFGNYARKKGWLREEGEEVKGGMVKRFLGKAWPKGEGGVRLLVEISTAYAITKALIPLRLVLSVWLTPRFAKISTLPVKNFIKRLVFRSSSKSTPAFAKANISPPAGTNATGGASKSQGPPTS